MIISMAPIPNCCSWKIFLKQSLCYRAVTLFCIAYSGIDDPDEERETAFRLLAVLSNQILQFLGITLLLVITGQG